jgi:hypothetical protein
LRSLSPSAVALVALGTAAARRRTVAGSPELRPARGVTVWVVFGKAISIPAASWRNASASINGDAATSSASTCSLMLSTNASQ